jgi:hypothetical protein
MKEVDVTEVDESEEAGNEVEEVGVSARYAVWYIVCHSLCIFGFSPCTKQCVLRRVEFLIISGSSGTMQGGDSM